MFRYTFVALLCLTASSHATTINVPADHTTIQGAINAAALNGDEIIVAPGTYNETINLMGKAVTLRSTDPNDPAVVATTIIDAQQTGTVITCDKGERSETEISGFTITGGRAHKGGGMVNSLSSPTVAKCIFTSNFASSGAGMANLFGSSPRVTNCTFIDNTVVNSGGGMFNEDTSRPTVTNCAFTNNISNSGGGMANSQTSSPRVTNCSFTTNTAFAGGGGMRSSGSCRPIVTNCTFSDNVAVSNAGGGMSNEDGSHPVVADSTFTGNSALLGPGGGMHNSDSSPTVTNCIFIENSATLRGWNSRVLKLQRERIRLLFHREHGYLRRSDVQLRFRHQ